MKGRPGMSRNPRVRRPRAHGVSAVRAIRDGVRALGCFHWYRDVIATNGAGLEESS